MSPRHETHRGVWERWALARAGAPLPFQIDPGAAVSPVRLNREPDAGERTCVSASLVQAQNEPDSRLILPEVDSRLIHAERAGKLNGARPGRIRPIVLEDLDHLEGAVGIQAQKPRDEVEVGSTHRDVFPNASVGECYSIEALEFVGAYQGVHGFHRRAVTSKSDWTEDNEKQSGDGSHTVSRPIEDWSHPTKSDTAYPRRVPGLLTTPTILCNKDAGRRVQHLRGGWLRN